MKPIVYILSLLTVFCVEGRWKIGKIINDSDIVFYSTCYIEPKEKEITGLTNHIQKYKGSRVIPVNHTVSNRSNGCCLIKGSVVNKATGNVEYYALVLSGNPAHGLHRSQARMNNREKRFACKQYCKLGSSCARIFLDKDDTSGSKEITCAGAEYTNVDHKDTVFDVFIKKSGDSYQISLQESSAVL